MQIDFVKFHGAGNDFVMIDNRQRIQELKEEHIAFLCDRHFGIGADGLMLLEASETHDFKMRYFNSDGREASMCGNGGRCIVAFADMLGISKKEYVFEAVDGLHKAKILNRDANLWEVSLQMLDVDEVEKGDDFYFLDTGSPHHITFVDNLDDLDVFDVGRRIRYSDAYKNKGGTNVNFVRKEQDVYHIRTYERGVEAETLACGTGVTAAAIAIAMENNSRQGEYVIKALGGDLKISFKREGTHFTDLWLLGPAQKVFTGNIDL